MNLTDEQLAEGARRVVENMRYGDWEWANDQAQCLLATIDSDRKELADTKASLQLALSERDQRDAEIEKLREALREAKDTYADYYEVVHRGPDGSGAVTPCCGRTPFELPRSDRMTYHDALVTCAALAGDREPEASLSGSPGTPSDESGDHTEEGT